MQFISKHRAPQTLVNPFIPMAASKDRESKKAAKFKTDRAKIKKEKVGEMRATAKRDDEYQPLYRQLNKDNPVDRNRYR